MNVKYVAESTPAKVFLVLREFGPYTVDLEYIQRHFSMFISAWATDADENDVYEGERMILVCLGVGRVTKGVP